MIELRAGQLQARIAPRGAELQSLRRGDEELMWQPQAGVWHQTAPWLFPFVGRLRGGGFLHAGRRYELPIHGFAAAMDFEIVEQRADAVRVRLAASDATRARYPFEFVFELGYRLDAQGLHIALQVRNEGEGAMPFALGGHPGFALDGVLEDWHLLFEHEEVAPVWRLQPEPRPWGLRAAAPERWPRTDLRRLPLHANLFLRDALILDPVHSGWVALVHRTRGEQLRVELGGAPQLGLWARPGAPYVCIEPWWGRDDAADASELLMDKPQVQKLAPGASFERQLCVLVRDSELGT